MKRLITPLLILALSSLAFAISVTHPVSVAASVHPSVAAHVEAPHVSVKATSVTPCVQKSGVPVDPRSVPHPTPSKPACTNTWIHRVGCFF